MAGLDTEVRYIKGIGEKKALALGKLGVFSLYDLVNMFPRRYEDRSVFLPISQTMDGQTVCIQAVAANDPVLSHVRRGMDLVKLRAVDESGSIQLTWFNQSYVKNALERGRSYNFYGKIQLRGTQRSMVNPAFEAEERAGQITGRIMPIYPLTAGLSQKQISQAMRQALDSCLTELPEILPEEVIRRQGLARAAFAYENIHFPSSPEALQLARRRQVFQELFVLSCALGRMRGDRTKEIGLKLDIKPLDPFWESLPFSPTMAQRRAVSQALADMSSGSVMSRLVQGDVGSGKTLVAAAVIWECSQNGLVSAMMAPTEILADQHFATLESFLGPLGLRVGKLTGSAPAAEKRRVKKQLANGELDVVVGTHALFSQDVEYQRLGLVVTDEQHRFGVRQRSALIGKGQKPHVLVMSATPIPRTLALMIYGDLDISVLDELPPGRQKVDTFAVDESYRQRLNGFIAKQVSEGRQVFVVCPKVEDDEDAPSDLRSAQDWSAALAQALPQLRIGCVHGKLKPKVKEEVMTKFLQREIDVLVATTVIEVGVDVPNASLMVIENAERFGLSQLHQLRGRVGRGSHKSYCVLVSDKDSPEAKARLKILCKTNDGFQIAQEDLRLRGPGDFFGARQHGLPETHLADLGADALTLDQAQQEARALLASDPDLSAAEHRALARQVERLYAANAGSLN